MISVQNDFPFASVVRKVN